MTHLIGYARTSTVEQEAGFDAQIRDLSALGVKRIFREQVSSMSERAQLDAAIDACQSGDTLVVTKLDRLARSIKNLINIMERLEAKGARLRIIAIGLDTSSPTGRLTLNILGSIAQFEREIMLERQKEGIAKAKADGKYRGRKPKDKTAARRLMAEGRTVAEIMAATGLGRSTVYEARI
jgi:DNA invertase Pin-like site-specific DNA recombinase